MADAAQNVINSPMNDPVTKAVVDNIMGNLPTKKPLVRCHDCDLCFTSQTVLDAHLQGARHAKQMRSKVIMATLEETKVAFTKDQEANGLKCNVCNVCLNSIQQLQTHLNGNRHKKKVMKGGWNGSETGQSESSSSTTTTATARVEPPTPLVNPVMTEVLTCKACNKFFNSKAQYEVHIGSKKHIQKLNRSTVFKTKKKRFVPYKKPTKTQLSQQSHMSLANSFVSGGYVYN